MKLKTNIWTQILGGAAVVASIAGLVPPPFGPSIILAATAVKGIISIFAQHSNTDGTPQELPFQPKK